MGHRALDLLVSLTRCDFLFDYILFFLFEERGTAQDIPLYFLASQYEQQAVLRQKLAICFYPRASRVAATSSMIDGRTRLAKVSVGAQPSRLATRRHFLREHVQNLKDSWQLRKGFK